MNQATTGNHRKPDRELPESKHEETHFCPAPEFQTTRIGEREQTMPKKVREPKNPFHPGEILLEEFLQPMGMTQIAFAEQVGWTRARLNELIRGKRGVTADAALDLSKATGTSAKLWMNLQATYDLDQARKRRSAA